MGPFDARLNEVLQESSSGARTTTEPASKTQVGKIAVRANIQVLFKQVHVINEVHRILMVVTAVLVCMAHGSNDVANAISPLIVALGNVDNKTSLSFGIGSGDIALGLLLLGKRVM